MFWFTPFLWRVDEVRACCSLYFWREEREPSTIIILLQLIHSIAAIIQLLNLMSSFHFLLNRYTRQKSLNFLNEWGLRVDHQKPVSFQKIFIIKIATHMEQLRNAVSLGIPLLYF